MTMGEAMSKEMGTIDHVYPTQMSEAEHRAFLQAELEHAEHVKVKIVNFHVVYYDERTGKVVSCHY